MGGTPYSDIWVLNIISCLIDIALFHETILTCHQCGFREYLRRRSSIIKFVIIVCNWFPHVLNLPRCQPVSVAHNHPATSVEQTGMMVSLNGNISTLLALCAGNYSVTSEFPTQRPVMRSFDVFFDLRMNKRLSKQSWGWWFGTSSRSLWRYCNR